MGLLETYASIEKNPNAVRKPKPSFKMNFINGPYLEISGVPGEQFDVSFTDRKTGYVHYRARVGNGHWCKSNVCYFVDWDIKLVDVRTGEEFGCEFDAVGKRVFIALESRSIGDTLAWVPYAEEFRRKWGCEVTLSTFWNGLFESQYPEIEFVPPGTVVHGIYAMYRIGWFYGEDGEFNPALNPRDFRKHSLQQTASDILGLDFRHVRPRLKMPGVAKERKVGIGFHSTAQAKYWNNETGWQEVCDFLLLNGYEVVILSKEGDGYMGNNFPAGVKKLPEGPFEDLMAEMAKCELFIGVGSGLSWLAWSMCVPTVVVSGFSEPVSEFDGEEVLRIFNGSVCNGCYNRYRLDAGDWNWCPDQKGTERQFECTKKITGGHVINRLISSGMVRTNVGN